MAPDKTRRAEDEYIAKEEAENTNRLKQPNKVRGTVTSLTQGTANRFASPRVERGTSSKKGWW